MSETQAKRELVQGTVTFVCAPRVGISGSIDFGRRGANDMTEDNKRTKMCSADAAMRNADTVCVKLPLTGMRQHK